MIAGCEFNGQLLTIMLDQIPILITRDVDNLKLGKQFTEVIQDHHVDRACAFTAANNQQYGQSAGNIKMVKRCRTVPQREVRAERVTCLKYFFGKELLRLTRRHCDHICKSS